MTQHYGPQQQYPAPWGGQQQPQGWNRPQQSFGQPAWPQRPEHVSGKGWVSGLAVDGEDRVWVYVRTWAQRSNASQYQRYWGDAVLLPTVSNTPRTTPAMVRDYFVHFLEKHPRGRIDSRSIQIGCNLAIDMGTYTFSVLGATGAPGEVAARYTYVYAFRDGEWKILHHHSSAMPEVLAAPATTATAQAGGAANGHDEAQTAKPEATAGDRKTRLASAEQQVMELHMSEALSSAESAEAGLPKGSPDWLRAQDIALQARAAIERQRKRR